MTAPTQLITCVGCGQKREPAMRHAIFCAECNDAMENAPPAPSMDGDALFARIKRHSDAEARLRSELGL